MATAPKKDGRLTKLQQTRMAWDRTIAAHYYYKKPKMGYRSVAELFDMPVRTVRNIVERTPRADPEVRKTAMRFGLITINLNGLEHRQTERQRNISNILSDG